MRKFLFSFIALFLLAGTTTVFSQALSRMNGGLQMQAVAAGRGASYRSSPSTPTAFATPRVNAVRASQLYGSPVLGGGNGPVPTATCGPDTLLYPLAKATGFTVIDIADSLSMGQWYDAPQNITVHGVSFFAWVDSATNQTVTLQVRLYNAAPDSTPTGAPLRTATIVIDSNFYNGNLGLLQKSVNFSSPATVSGPYVVTVENNNSLIDVGFVANDINAVPRDGLGEWLSCVYIPGGPMWTGSRFVIFGGSIPYDVDNLIMPHVSYTLASSFTPNPATGCVGVPVSWTNTSSPVLLSRFYNFNAATGNTAGSYNWNYGDGSPIDNVINGLHTYAAPGAYNVTLVDSVIGWTVNCTETFTGTVNISSGTAVVANFSQTSTGLSASFTDATSGSPTAWLWVFGDGTTGTAQNPNHTYPSNGIYNVCLIATNNCGSDTTCQQVLIGPPPVSSCDTIGNITGTPTLFGNGTIGYVSGHNVFQDSAKAEYFNNTQAFSFEEALYWFALKRSNTPLISKVIATVWDATGPGGSPGTAIRTQDLFYNNIDTTGALTSVVFSPPVVTSNDFYVGLSLIYNGTDTVALVNNANGQTVPPTAWELDSSGTWQRYDGPNSWGLDVSHAIWVVQRVAAGFTFGTVGLNATFTDQSEGAIAWTWDFGDGTSSTLQNPTHTYATGGTYTVCQFAFNGTCIDSVCQTITISGGCPTPTAAFTSTQTGTTVTFTNTSSTTGSSPTFAWDFGDGSPLNTQQSPTHSYATAGFYTVCMVVIDSCGNDTVCNTFLVGCPGPTADWTWSMAGLNASFTDLSSLIGSSPTWAWDFGDGSPVSNLQNPTHTYAIADTFTVCLMVMDSCGSDTFCFDVISGCNTPVANFSFTTSNLTATFTDLSTGSPTSWIWDFGDGTPVVTTQNPTHNYAAQGTYNVCLTVINGCGSSTICQTVTIVCPLPVANYTFTITGLTVNFTDISTGNPNLFAWDFGDGSPISFIQNATHTYATAGTYLVCFGVQNACGQDSVCMSISVGCSIPQAGFTNTASNLTLSFTDNSTGTPTSWAWDFGDGSPVSTQQNPTHTYGSTGTYNVCLTATNACGSTTICQSITVTCPTPTANFTSTGTGLAFQFTSTSSGSPTTFSWNFGDGTTSSSQNPSHTYGTPGTYSVCLTVTNACGSNTFCQNVNALCPLPVAGFTNTNGSLTVNFTNTTTNGGTYIWDFGDGNTSLLTTPSHSYAAPGVYTVCLIALNSCGNDTVCQTLNVTCTAPTANFSFVTTGNTIVTTNTTANPSGSPITYAWSFGDGTTSTATSPTHAYTSTGVFQVCLVASSICGADTFCQNVIVSCVPPTAGFTSSVTDSIVTLTNTSSLNSTAFTWTFGDGSPASTLTNPTHTYSAPGTYTICLIVSNTCGLDTICNTVTITCTNPTSGYNVSLSNGVATFTDISLLPTSWFWSFGDGSTSTQQNPIHSYSISGTYTVCLTVTNFCGTNTSCQNLIVTCNNPTASFSYTNGVGTTNFLDLTNNNPVRWLWDFGDGTTDTIRNPQHGYLYTGNFYVCLTAWNSCGSSDTCMLVSVTTIGIEDQLFSDGLTVFPNPNNGSFTLQGDLLETTDLSVKVYNTLGQEVYGRQEMHSYGAFSQSIQLGGVARGVYSLEVTGNGKRLIKKIIVE